MAKKVSDGRYRRVAEGVYERNGSYYVPIWERDADGKAGKRWHGPNCNGVCSHEPIRDLSSARDAKRDLEKVKRKQVRGRKDETVKSWRERWMEVFPRKAESTMIHNEERTRSFERDFGSRSLRSLENDRETLRAWALANASCVRPVRAMLNDAIKIGLLDTNPFSNLQLEQSRGRSDITVLTIDELEMLAQVALEVHGAHEGGYGPWMAAMVRTAAWTGLRPGELYVLCRRPSATERTNWVDFAAGEVVVDWQLNSKTMKRSLPKWDSRRRVVLLPEAEKALMSLPDDGTDLPIFRTKRGGGFTQRSFHYYWDPVRATFTSKLPAGHWLRQRLKLDPENGNFDFYELRHFFGTMLAQPPEGVRGATGPEIALQMGHKDGGTLAYARYVHLSADQANKSIRNAWRSAPAGAPGEGGEEATG